MLYVVLLINCSNMKASKWNKLIIAFLSLLMSVSAQTQPKLPPGCECPLDCVCSLSSGTIDCSQADLQFVPVEINSCEWPGITTIDLSGNFIGTVHDYAFSQLLQVTRLYLFDNQIAVIGDNAFVGLESLEVLFLDGNRISTLSRRVFRSLKNLKRLLLYSNELTTLPYGIFEHQKSLTQLALYNNRIDTLRTEVFDELPALEQLYLHNNHITDLSNAPFRNLVQLKTLYLNDNRLSTISRYSFLGLFRLTLLILSRNSISLIESDTFNPTTALQYLYLESNRLTEVDRLMFAGPVNLVSLHLYANQITRISDGSFYRLRKLQKLSLHSNRISRVWKQTFVGMDSLQELVLYNNQLTNISAESFAQLTTLTRLWLYGNQISCLEPKAFMGLRNLQILQLSTNKISYIPDELFERTPNLLYLFLYENSLVSIGNTPFKNLPRLIQLSLYYNPIEYIAAGSLEGSNSLYYLQWSDFGDENYLVCDCSALWLYQWMSSRALQSSVVCNEPPQHKGVDIRALQAASFGCSGAVLSVTIEPNADNHVVAEGGCLRVVCSSSPRGPVVWSRLDGEPVRSRPKNCAPAGGKGTSCYQGGDGDGVLVIENIRPEDSGYYLCTAEFRNTTRSQICRITVGSPPVIEREPDDVLLASPGPTVSFSLEYSGHPQPTVSWYKITADEEEVPLTEQGVSSRYMVSTEGTLVLLGTVLEDQGFYRAVVSNGAGSVSVEAQLSFFNENICRGECLNDGACVSVPVCSCKDGFGGKQCETALNTDVTKAPTTEDISTTSAPSIQTTTVADIQTTEDDYYGSGNNSTDDQDDYEYDYGSGNSTDEGSGDDSNTNDQESSDSRDKGSESNNSANEESPDQETGDDSGSGEEQTTGNKNDKSDNFLDYYDGMGGAVGRKRKREALYSDGNNRNTGLEIRPLSEFQTEIHQIMSKEREFETQVNEAIEIHKARGKSTVKILPFAEETVISSKGFRHMKHGKDIFGQEIEFEYLDDSDPYKQVPTSKN